MSYLIFIVAAGLFALLGAGGPVHRDNWFDALSRRVDAVELDLWPSLLLRVVAPLIGAGIALLVLAVLTSEAFDRSISDSELLAQGIERAWHLDDDSSASPDSAVIAIETTQKAITRATAAWLVVISVLALL